MQIKSKEKTGYSQTRCSICSCRAIVGYHLLERLPPVVAPKNGADLITFEVFQRNGEASPGFGVGAFATALVLGITDGFLVFLLPPIVPTLGQNVLVHVATDKGGLRVGTPRTRKVNTRYTTIGGELAVVKQIPMRATFGCRGCRYVTVSLAVNPTSIEHCGRRAEDKIDGSLDVTRLVVLAALLAVGVQRILKAKEAAVLEECTVCIDKAGNSLPHGAGAVLKREVLGIEVGAIDVTSR